MSPLRPLRAALFSVVAFALPPRCPGCGVVTLEDHRFCLDCWLSLDFLGQPACAMCGEPLDDVPVAEEATGLRCGACLARPRAFDGMAAAVSYGEIARAIALRLKHGRRPALAETVARQMARAAGDIGDTLVAPVPLHRWRIWRRGYNQSALIVRALVPLAGGTRALDLLERRKATPVLRAMGPARRAATVRGAFAVPERWKAAVKGRSVLLVDDVYTTGATADACARALKRAGAAEVRVLCWARVPRDRGPDVDFPPPG